MTSEAGGDLLSIHLTVNGRGVDAQVATDCTLYGLLHAQLGWKDVRYGCGEGVCGACLVLFDGAPRASCLMLAAQADGASIDTAAGMAESGNATYSALTEQLVAGSAFQCGYCSCGMMLSALHHLESGGKATDESIRRAISGNLCRCSGYRQIVDGIRAAAADDPVTDEPLRGAGRPDLREKMSGSAGYPTDRRSVNELVGRILWSERSSARIVEIDTDAALQVEGVEAVLTARDIPGKNLGGVSIFAADQPLLAEDRVRSRSDAVALIAAQTDAAARDAVDKIVVRYEPLPAVLSVEDALREDAPRVGSGGNTIAQFNECRGDVEAGFETADVVVEATYRTTINDHACMEPEGGAAWYNEGYLTLAFPTQSPYAAHQAVSRVLGVPESAIRLETARTGGGFGKYLATSVEGYLALLAHQTRQPVRLQFTREEALARTAKRHEFEGRYRIGLKRDGTIVALEADVLTDSGPYVALTPAVVSVFAVEAAGGYEIPNLQVRVRGVLTNNLVTAPMRGFGTQQIAFGIESLVEKAAHMLGMDPAAFRLKNARTTIHDGRGRVIPDADVPLRETLERVVERLGPRPTPPPGWIAGRGLSAVHAKYGFPYGFVDRFSSRVSVDTEGRFVVEADIPDLGTGISAGLPDIVARRLGLVEAPEYRLSADAVADPTGFLLTKGRRPSRLRLGAYRLIERLQTTVAGRLQAAIAGLNRRSHVRFTRASSFLVNAFGSFAGQLKSTLAPAGVDSFLPRMGGSRTMSMAGRAALEAADHLKQAAREAASPILGAPARDLVCDGDGVCHRAHPEQRLSWDALAEAAGGSLSAVGTARLPRGRIFDSKTGNQIGPVDFADASHGCDLIVNPESGEVRIQRYVVCQDVGHVFNRDVIHGQIYGGVVMGISQVLYEKIRIDEHGVATKGLHDYLVPTSLDVVENIEIDLLESGTGMGPEGSKGIGESPAVTAPSAIANALYDALGIQIETIPITPEEISHLAQEHARAGRPRHVSNVTSHPTSPSTHGE